MKSSSTNSERGSKTPTGRTGRSWFWIVASYGVWMTVLVLLACSSPEEVVSVSQLALAPVVVHGRVVPDGFGGWQVHVREIFQAPAGLDRQIKPGSSLSVAHLPQARGWNGVGEYVLPLKPLDQTEGWEVVPVPNSVGLITSAEARPRVYWASATVLRQVRHWFRHRSSAEQ